MTPKTLPTFLQARDAFYSLMLHNAKSSQPIDQWIDPLLNAIADHPQSAKFESCLVEILGQHPHLLLRLNDWFQLNPDRLHVYFIALLAARKVGLIESSAAVAAAADTADTQTWNNVVPVHVFQSALQNADDKVLKLEFKI